MFDAFIANNLTQQDTEVGVFGAGGTKEILGERLSLFSLAAAPQR